MNGEIVKASLFKSHYEAAQQMPVEMRCAFYDAMFRYQFTGEMGDNLPPAIKWIMTAILPVLDKEIECRQGRPECVATAEEVAAKKEELGSAKAAAEHFGISERTVYNKLKTAKDCKGLQTAKTAKTNVECRKKNEEREKGKAAEQSAKAPQTVEQKLIPLPLSDNSVIFPSEQIPLAAPCQQEPFCPPKLEDVTAYCEERKSCIDAETFFAYYTGTGWKRKGGAAVTDWRAEVALWEKRERKDARARASPQYKTWVAEPRPEMDEEERGAIAAGLAGMLGNIKKNIAGGQG